MAMLPSTVDGLDGPINSHRTAPSAHRPEPWPTPEHCPHLEGSRPGSHCDQTLVGLLGLHGDNVGLGDV